jgi:hypothetical protein
VALKNESVVDKWSTLVLNGAGKSAWVIAQIESKIAEAKLPGVRATEREVRAGVFGERRNFLLVAHNGLPDFFLYIGARDFGIHLDVAWYLTIQPKGLKRALSRYSSGNPLALSMQLDFFRQQDANAFVTAVHHTVTDTAKELLDELDQNPAGLNTQSKGFLSVW